MRKKGYTVERGGEKERGGGEGVERKQRKNLKGVRLDELLGAERRLRLHLSVRGRALSVCLQPRFCVRRSTSWPCPVSGALSVRQEAMGRAPVGWYRAHRAHVSVTPSSSMWVDDLMIKMILSPR